MKLFILDRPLLHVLVPTIHRQSAFSIAVSYSADADDQTIRSRSSAQVHSPLVEYLRPIALGGHPDCTGLRPDHVKPNTPP